VLVKLRGEMEDLLLFGPGQARAAAAHGQMAGLRTQILAAAGSNIDLGDGTRHVEQPEVGLHLHRRQDQLAGPAERGQRGSNLICLVPAAGYTLAGGWGAAAVTRSASDRTYGFETNTLHSSIGLEVPLVWSSRMKGTEAALISLDYFEKCPRGRRKLIRYVKPAGIVLNDYESRRLVAEWGCRSYFLTKAHYWMKGIRYVR